MNDNERREWVNNDEGLYLWWKSSRTGLYTWVKDHRKEIDETINQIISPNHLPKPPAIKLQPLVTSHDNTRQSRTVRIRDLRSGLPCAETFARRARL